MLRTQVKPNWVPTPEELPRPRILLEVFRKELKGLARTRPAGPTMLRSGTARATIS